MTSRTRHDWTAEFGDESQPLSGEPTTSPDGAGPFTAGKGYASRFPTDALPAPMAAYARDLAVRKQVAVDLPVLTMLGIIGSVAGPRITIRRDLDWRQPTNLYTACAMVSGATKSPVIMELQAGLWKAKSALREIHERDTAERIVELTKQVEALRAKANSPATMPDERDILRTQAKTLEAQAEEMTANPPPAPELVFDGDTSAEALGESLASNQGYAAVIDDEGTFLRNLGGLYSGGKTGNLGLALVGYDCRYYRPKRITRVAGSVDRAALSLVISPQPGIVADMLRNETMKEAGLINRFFLCVPGDFVGYRTERPSTYFRDVPQHRPDRDGREWWAKLLTDLVSYPVIGATDAEDAATIDLSREAWKLHREYERQVEVRMRPGGDLNEVRPWASKHVARVLRLSATLHLAAGYSTDDEVSEPTMANAIKGGEWSVEHFIAAGKVVGLSEGAGRIKEYIDGTDLGFATRSIISREVFKGHATADNISGWINELTAGGDYAVTMLATGGRPKEVVKRVRGAK